MSTAKYDREGISFQYPENWQLEEDPPRGLPRTISVTSQEGAFWSVAVYDASADTESLRREYIQTLQQEYEGVELDLLSVQIGDLELPATDFQFYCLDFLVHSRLISCRHGEQQLLISWQAEDRDFDRLEQVFMAITLTALSGDEVPKSSSP